MAGSPGDFPADMLDAAIELMGKSGRGGTVPVRGVSMLPTLVEGQLLAVEFSPGDLRRGDVLLFRLGNDLVVHRLLGGARFPDGRPSLRTRGDGTIALDPHLEIAEVVGRVTAFRDAGGWWGLRTRPARFYATLVAWHDLFWAATGAAATDIDRRLSRLPVSTPCYRLAGRLDGICLHVAHRLFFRWFHSRTTAPGADVADAGGGERV